MFHHTEYFSRVAPAVDEGKSDQLPRIPSHDAGYLRIGLLIVAVQGCKDNRFVDPSRSRTPQIWFDRSVRVPGSGHLVTLAGMTVAIDDHAIHSLRDWDEYPDCLTPRNAFSIAAMYQIEVSIPR
jgi:hypothetical protein